MTDEPKLSHATRLTRWLVSGPPFVFLLLFFVLHMFEGRYAAALEGWRDWQRELEQARSPYRLVFAWLHAARDDREEALRQVKSVLDL